MSKIVWLFAGLCVLTLAVMIYFAEWSVTESAPDYSTWNSKPNGAKLLFDALKAANFAQVARQFKPTAREKPQNATVLFLGVPAFALSSEDAEYFRSMEAAAERGNRLVIAIPNESFYTFRPELRSEAEETPLFKRWGIQFKSDKGMFSAYPEVDKQWKAMEGTADAWQRRFGRGTVTLVANGQRLNNKSIATDLADRQLLYRLVSEQPMVIFEEAHLGIEETGSIMGLARHYHLQGLMLGLILLAALFIWNRSVSFPPPLHEPEKPLVGPDARDMLAEMMSRHLKSELMATCISEWNRTRGHRPLVVTPAEKNAVRAYHQIQVSQVQNRLES